MKKGVLALLLILLLPSCEKNMTDRYLFEYEGVEMFPSKEADKVIEKIDEEYKCSEESLGCGMGRTCRIYSYESFVIRAVDGKIETVTLKNDSVSTPEGVRIGDDAERVIKIYGGEYQTRGESIIYIKDEITLNFVVREGVVTSIYYQHKSE